MDNKFLKALMLCAVLTPIGTLFPIQGRITTVKLPPQPQWIDNAYVAGYIDDGYIPLTVFLPPGLKGANTALQRHHFAKAESIFVQEMKAHPNNTAIILGYLQSIPNHWDELMPAYQREAQAHPNSAAALFKLGVLAAYIFNERGYQPSHDMSLEALKLWKTRWQSLERAFQINYDPVVGFTIAWSAIKSAQGEYPKDYEDIIRRMGGPAVWQAYDHAKRAGWRAKQPPIPRLSLHNLIIFRWTVACLWQLHGGRNYILSSRRIVNGVWEDTMKLAPLRPSQKRAMAYLWRWRVRLIEAIKAKQKAAR